MGTYPVTVGEISPELSTLGGTPALTFGSTYVAGAATTFLRTDDQIKFPASLMSAANSTLLTLTDSGTTQTLTAGLSDLNLQLASGGGFVIRPDVTTAPLSTLSVQIRPGVGTVNGIVSAMFPGNITSNIVSAWNANCPFGSATYTTASLCGYRVSTLNATPSVSSDANNKMYGFLGTSPIINNANGGWLEVAGAYVPGPSRLVGAVSVSGNSAGIIVEPSTVGTITQYGIKVQQRTAQQVATDRIGIDIDAQNSGTNRYSLRCGDQTQLTVSTESYTPGSFTVATGRGCVLTRQLQLTGTQRATLAGTARLRMC